MNIVLYRNNSVANKVIKNLTTVATITGTLKYETTVISPSIIIERNSFDFNYFKVTEWNRYYFLGTSDFGINGMITMNGNIDVLMSFSSDILNARAILLRQENLWNMYLSDSSIVMNQNAKHRIIKFPNSFSNFSYILALAGNSQTA